MELTQAVLESFAGASSERFRELISSLVTHLHAFASEVSLTEEEWFAGIDFLTRVGHITDEKRQEFVLLSDVLGLSMLVVGLNHRSVGTESTVFGPFFVSGSPRFADGEDIAGGFSGEPCFISGRVTDPAGAPIAGARVEVWQADDSGLYDVQHAELEQPCGRGHLFTLDDGTFSFWSVKPEPYPIPSDGPVGELLKAGARGPMRPAHVHFMISADGYRPLITHVFVEGDPYLETDAVFGVRQSLVAPFERDGDHWRARYEFVLMSAQS